MNRTLKFRTYAIAFSTTLLPGLASASVIGFLGNFDVINDTGSTAYGFEIELEGVRSYEITDTFGGAGRGFPSGRGFDPANAVVRYGAPEIIPYDNGGTNYGSIVRYTALWDANALSWDYGTPSGSFITPGDNCWTGGGVGYGSGTPCDHFGVGTSVNPSKTTYSWLHDDGSNSGQLTNVNGKVILPAPVWDVQPSPPPADPGAAPAPPVVVAKIESPEPEIAEIDGEAQFGEAIWVKVFTTELENNVELEDLIGGNPVIDQAKQHTEIEWQLLQYDPGNPDSAKLEAGYGAPVGKNAESIIRRYEFYKFAGEYDPGTHEAKPFSGSDSHPDPEDLGIYLGAQNAAANLQIAAPAVPLPATFWLMGTSLLGFWIQRRKTV